MTPSNSQAKMLISKQVATSRNHPCYFCDKMFQKYYKLEAHMNLHIEQRPYQCLQCPSNFGDPRRLARHMHVTHLKVCHTCVACEKYFSDRYSLKRHVQNKCAGIRATSAKQTHKHFCQFCDKKFVKYSNLEYHVNKHIKQNPYQCLKCPSSFTVPRDLKRHVKATHLKIRYKCSSCDTYFSRPDSIRLHFLRGKCNGMPETNFQLENVNNEKISLDADVSADLLQTENTSIVATAVDTFPMQTSLAKHNGVKCRVCENVFSNRSSMNRHYRNVHSNSNTVTGNTKCFICPAMFSRRDNMMKHYKRIHLKTTKVPIYSCVPCNLKFENQFQLTSHQVSMHSKKYQCKVCQTMFTRSDALKRHLKRCSPSIINSNWNPELARIQGEAVKASDKHSTIQKDYQCRKCKTRFTRMSNLTRHIKRKSCPVNTYSESESDLKTDEISETEEENDDDSDRSQTETELADKAENNSDDDKSIDQEDDFLFWEELVLMQRNERRQANNKYDFFLHLNRYNTSA